MIPTNNDSEIMLWHYRLGHPNFLYLKTLFPKLFNKNNSSKTFQCEICQLPMHIQNHYPIQGYKTLHPFSMIHSDIWGHLSVAQVVGCVSVK